MPSFLIIICHFSLIKDRYNIRKMAVIILYYYSWQNFIHFCLLYYKILPIGPKYIKRFQEYFGPLLFYLFLTIFPGIFKGFVFWKNGCLTYLYLYDIDVHFNLIAFTGQRLVLLYFIIHLFCFYSSFLFL